MGININQQIRLRGAWKGEPQRLHTGKRKIGKFEEGKQNTGGQETENWQTEN